MFSNIGKMMKLAGELKTRLPEIRQRLEGTEYCGASDDGSIKATVNGRGALVNLDIAPSALSGAIDASSLGRQVIAAVSAAQEAASQAAAAAMKELTGGIEIPGMDGIF